MAVKRGKNKRRTGQGCYELKGCFKACQIVKVFKVKNDEKEVLQDDCVLLRNKKKERDALKKVKRKLRMNRKEVRRIIRNSFM